MKTRHLTTIDEKTDSAPTVYRERTLGPWSDWWVSVHLYNSTDLPQKLFILILLPSIVKIYLTVRPDPPPLEDRSKDGLGLGTRQTLMDDRL